MARRILLVGAESAAHATAYSRGRAPLAGADELTRLCEPITRTTAAAAAAAGRNDNRALKALVAEHPRAFRIEAGGLALIAVDCRERVLHRFPLAAPLFSARD
jgi:hypothetical protein